MTGEKIFTRDFVMVVALNFLLFLSFEMTPSALPVYAASIGVPKAWLGLISGAFTLSALVARPFAGVAADRYGRKGILLAGLVVMTVCMAAYALCPLFIPLVIIRFVQGIGWGGSTTAASAIASDTLPRSRFGEGMGYFGLSVSVSLAIGPALGLYLLDAFGMRVLSVTATVILLVALGLGLAIRTVRTHGEGAGRGDAVPADAPQEPKRPEDGTAKREGVIERAAIVPATVMGIMTCGYGVIVSFLALMVAERGIGTASGFFVVFAITAIISRPLIGRYTDKHGFKRATVAGIVLQLAGLVLVTAAGSFTMLLASGMFFGFGQGILQTTLQTEAVVSSPRNRAGAANATFYVGFDGGIGVGALLGGAVSGALGYTAMFGLTCILPVLALLVYLGTSRLNGR